VQTICKKDKDIMLALGAFTYEAPFRFAGMATFDANILYNKVMKDLQLVRNGKNKQLLYAIM